MPPESKVNAALPSWRLCSGQLLFQDRRFRPPAQSQRGGVVTKAISQRDYFHGIVQRLAGEAVDNPEHREGLAMLQANHRIYFFPFVTSPGNRVSTMVTWPLIALNQ
jgi:hypothetical protein